MKSSDTLTRNRQGPGGKRRMVDLWVVTKAEDNPSDLRKYSKRFPTEILSDEDC